MDLSVHFSTKIPGLHSPAIQEDAKESAFEISSVWVCFHSITHAMDCHRGGLINNPILAPFHFMSLSNRFQSKVQNK